MSDVQKDQFLNQENQYTRLMLMKYDFMEKMMLREFEHYNQLPQVDPIQIGEYIYYRKVDNPADSLSLYRFPADELQRYGLKNEVPYLRKPLEDLSEEQL